MRRIKRVVTVGGGPVTMLDPRSRGRVHFTLFIYLTQGRLLS